MPLGEARYLLAAAVLHLALPVAAHIAPTPEVGFAVIGRGQLAAEILVDVENLPWPERPPSPDDVYAIGHRNHTSHRYTSRRPHNPFLPPPDHPTDPSSDPPPEDAIFAEPSTEPGPSDWHLPPMTPDMTGVPTYPGAMRAWSIPDGMPPPIHSRPAPTRTNKRRPVNPRIATQVIEDVVRAKDRELGLDLPAAAAVASAVAVAVRSAETPSECHGTVSVTLSGQGKVQDVRLGSYAGGAAGVWQQVVRIVRSQLAPRTFPMPSTFSKGAIVTVSVRSLLRTPSGGGSRQGLGFSFDTADIGASATRHVTTGVSVHPVR